MYSRLCKGTCVGDAPPALSPRQPRYQRSLLPSQMADHACNAHDEAREAVDRLQNAVKRMKTGIARLSASFRHRKLSDANTDDNS